MAVEKGDINCSHTRLCIKVICKMRVPDNTIGVCCD